MPTPGSGEVFHTGSWDSTHPVTSTVDIRHACTHSQGFHLLQKFITFKLTHSFCASVKIIGQIKIIKM